MKSKNFSDTETNSRYKYFLDNLSKYIDDTLSLYNKKEASVFKEKLFKAKRIFFTGTGSSMPSAMFGAQYCSELGLPAQFLTNGGVIGMNLGRGDLIFLSTQGFNRGDAELVAKKVKKDGAILAVLTANTDSFFLSLADFSFLFSPFPEKLFCRPVGVQTGILALAKILIDDIDIKKIKIAIEKANTRKKEIFNKKAKYVVLSSGIGMPIAINYALALREGCGIDSQAFDVETYGHGMYVSDQTLKNSGVDVKYIVINFTANNHVYASTERIKLFINKSRCSLLEVRSNSEIIYGYIEQLTYLANCVLETNKINNYNMNEPFGKEENKYYHKAKSYKISEIKLKKFIEEIKTENSKNKNGSILIEISGGSCVGKSTFVEQVKSKFLSAEIVPQDSYQIGKNFKYKKTSRYKFDDPRNFQLEKCFTDLKKLISGKKINRPDFNLEKNISTGIKTVYPKDILIFDGIYSSFPPLNSLSKLKLYIETPYYVRFLRRIERFIRDGHSEEFSVPLRHITGPVYLAHKDFVIKQKKYADLVIQGSEDLPVFARSFEREFKGMKVNKSIFKRENVEVCIGDKNKNKYLCIFQNEKCCYISQIDKNILRFINKVDWLSV